MNMWLPWLHQCTWYLILLYIHAYVELVLHYLLFSRDVGVKVGNRAAKLRDLLTWMSIPSRWDVAVCIDPSHCSIFCVNK